MVLGKGHVIQCCGQIWLGSTKLEMNLPWTATKYMGNIFSSLFLTFKKQLLQY